MSEYRFKVNALDVTIEAITQEDAERKVTQWVERLQKDTCVFVRVIS